VCPTFVVLSFDIRYGGLFPMPSFFPGPVSIPSALGWLFSLALYGNSRVGKMIVSGVKPQTGTVPARA
ncbi:MAG: hypothetical protein IKF98_12980, partial [Clostridia bacterium]|nr:hypothetical protein [Clostridia bacterium]